MHKDFDSKEVRLGQGVNTISLDLQNSALTQTTSTKVDARKVDAKFFITRSIREMHENFDASLNVKGPQVVPGIKANLTVIQNKYQYDLYSAVSLTCTEFVQVLDEGFTLNQTARALIGAKKPISPQEQIVSTQLALLAQTAQQAVALQQSLVAQHAAAVTATQQAMAAQQTLADQLTAVTKPLVEAEQAIATQQNTVLQAHTALSNVKADVKSNTKARDEALEQDKVLRVAKEAAKLQQAKIDESFLTLQKAQAELSRLKKLWDEAIAADIHPNEETTRVRKEAQEKFEQQQTLVTNTTQAFQKNVTDMAPLTKGVDDATSKNKTFTDAEAALTAAKAKLDPSKKALSDAKNILKNLKKQKETVKARTKPMRDEIAAQQEEAAGTVAKALLTQQTLVDQLKDAAKAARKAQKKLEKNKAQPIDFDRKHKGKALDRFASVYGDAFVDRITYGRWAFIVIQYHLQTQDQQTKVGLQLNGIGGGLPGGVSVDASFANQLTRSLNNLDYTINIFSGGIDQPAIGLLNNEGDLNKLLSTFSIEGQKSAPTQLDWTYQPYAKAGVTESAKAAVPNQGGTNSTTNTAIQVPTLLYGNEDDKYLANLRLFHSRTGYARTVNHKLIEIREYLEAQMESLDLPQIDMLLLNGLTSSAAHAVAAVAATAQKAAIPAEPEAYIFVDDFVVDVTVDNKQFDVEKQIALLGSSERHRALIPLRNIIFLIRALLPIVADMQKSLADNLTNHREINSIATKTNQLLKFHLNKLHQVVSSIYNLNDRVWLPVKRVADHQITGPHSNHKHEEYSFDLQLPEHTDALTFLLHPENSGVPVKFKKHDFNPKKCGKDNKSPFGASTVNGNYKMKEKTLLADINGTPIYPVTQTMNHLYFKRTQDAQGQHDVNILAHCRLFRPKNSDMPLSLAILAEPPEGHVQVPQAIPDGKQKAEIDEGPDIERINVDGGPGAAEAKKTQAFTNINAQEQAMQIQQTSFKF